MKKLLSLLILIALVLSICAFAVSCNDTEPAAPTPENKPDDDETTDPDDSSGKGDLYDPENNTWQDPNADWQGKPVPLPTT